MTPDNREELVSAYLDDELSAEERARVEQWLAESPELRQFHDELRATRSRLQSLPRHQLDHDLASRVIRQAQQASLKDEATSPADDVTPGTIMRQWWSQGRGWRRVVWPMVAIAAALLIAFFDRNPQPAERQVAQHAPREEGSIGAPKDKSPETAKPTLLAKERGEGRLAGSAAASLDESSANKAGEAPAMKSKELYGAKSKPAAGRGMQAIPGEAAGATSAKREALQTLSNAQAEADSDELVEIDVKPVFVEEKQLERSLDAKNIVWYRVEEPPVAEAESAARDSALPPAPAPKAAPPKIVASPQQKKQDAAVSQNLEGLPQYQYFVTLTPAQLDEITDEFSQDRARVVGVRRGVTQAIPNKSQMARQSQMKEARTRDALLKDKAEQAPPLSNVTIRLVPVTEPPEKNDEKP